MAHMRRLWMLLIVGAALLGVRAAQGQENVTLTISRSADSLTLYLPPDPPFVNLSGLQFQTADTAGRPIIQPLETLPAFLGLPYATLPTPICFHITRSAAPEAPPLECQIITTVTQRLVDANVFWIDVSAQQERTLTIVLYGLPRICPSGNVRCELAYPLPTPTPTLPLTLTPSPVPIPPTPSPSLTPQLAPTLDVNAVIAATRAVIETQNALNLTSTATLWTPTPSNTPTPTEDIPATIAAALTATEAYNRAFTGVARNEDWTPQIELFNGVEMVLVPAGCFMMGSEDGEDDEKPVHEICFDAPFWIDRYEVTNAQFAQFGGQAENDSNWTDENRPRETIDWFEARDFCENKRPGEARLPTEAEWEYAARGVSNWAYPWGDDWNADYAVYGGNSNQTANVGSYPAGASWVGALDMIGNVWEWVSSLYQPYPYDEDDGRENNQDTNSLRVLRGGSWYDVNPDFLRASFRNWVNPNYWDSGFGFRCARSG